MALNSTSAYSGAAFVISIGSFRTNDLPLAYPNARTGIKARTAFA
jgi:hypothetical protein